MSNMTTSSPFFSNAAVRQRRASSSACASLSAPTVSRVVAMPFRCGAKNSLRAMKRLAPPSEGRAMRAFFLRATTGFARFGARDLGRFAISFYQRAVRLHSFGRNGNAALSQVFNRRFDARQHALVERTQRARLELRALRKLPARFERVRQIQDFLKIRHAGSRHGVRLDRGGHVRIGDAEDRK